MKLGMFILFMFSSSLLPAQQIIKPEKPIPEVVIDEYHGVKLEDPYRYMEDLKNPKVLNWMKANTKYAESILEAIPERDKMIKKIEEMDSRKASSISNLNITDNDNYYYLKTRPEDQTGKLYFRKGYEGEERLLLDPENYNKESEAIYTISSITPNHKGDRVAVILAPDGSENGELIILDENASRVGNTLQLVEYVNWKPDDKSLYYLKLNSSDISDMKRQLNLKIYSHNIGESQNMDLEIFSSAKNPDLKIKAEEYPIVVYDKDSDRTFGLVVTVNKAIKIYMNDAQLSGPWQQLTTSEDMVSNFSTSKDAIFYKSFKGAPNFRILKADLKNPKFHSAKIFIPEQEMGPIEDMAITKDGLYYTVKSNGVETKLFSKSVNNDIAKQIELPLTAGSAFINSKGSEFSDLWVNITGWTTPGKRFKFQSASNGFVNEPMSSEAEYPELEDLVVKEVMVTSHDGVQIPVSILHRKNIKMDGSTPATLYSYGSYGISTGPFFSPLLLVQTLYGGMFVVPHVRGGGELGDSWHRAGQKLNKPNTWKDAIATAEYLIEEGYTKPEKLSIFGGSAGGILVGRTITERPDLFSAAAPMVGAMNTVRMEETPNGPINAPEFGTVKDPEEFKGLLEMDSYHHVENGVNYPAMLVTSGMNDPRVIAWEPAKFAARMQVASASNEPVLLLTDFDSGHGIGDTKAENFELFANIFSFFYWQAGHPKFQPPKDLVD
jgi:prolyl oligopeptidase